MNIKHKVKKKRNDGLKIYHLCIIETLLYHPNSTSEFIYTKRDMSSVSFYRYIKELENMGIVFVGRIYVGENRKEWRYTLHEDYLKKQEYKGHNGLLELANDNIKIILGGKISIEYEKDNGNVLINGQEYYKQSYVAGCRAGYKDAIGKINKENIDGKQKVSFYLDNKEQVELLKKEKIVDSIKDFVKNN